MLAMLTSLWTPEQIILTVAVVVCCVLLVAFGWRSRQQTSEPQTPDGHRRTPLAGKLVLTIVLIAVAAFLAWRSGDPIGIRTDSWSEANAIISGQYYARAGLLANWGAAQHQVVTDTHPSDLFFLYTRYPVGSNLINGIWQIAGVHTVAMYRILPSLCSLAAVLLWFTLYRRLAGPTVAVVAAVTMALSYGFLAYADNIYFHGYAMLASVAAMCCYVRAMQADRHRLRWFLLTALLMFVTAWFTWEYHLWMVLFIALYALLFKCPVRRPYLLLLGLPLIVALAMQAAQRRLAFADVRVEATSDDGQQKEGILDDIYRRTLGFAEATDTPRGVTLATYPKYLLLRYYKFYGLPAVGAVALLLMLLMTGGRAPWRVRGWTDAERLVVILLVAGSGWWLIMLQHTSVHPHVTRQGLAGYSLLMALAWVHCWRALRSGAWPATGRVVAGVLALVLCYPELEGLYSDVQLHRIEQYDAGRERNDAGVIESRQLSELESLVPPGAVILTNHNRRPLMRLWTGRPVYSGHLSVIPRDDKEHGRMMIELRFNHLRELYNDHLPPLYYVYLVRTSTVEAAAGDPLLCFLVVGSFAGDGETRERAIPILVEAWATGHSARSFCPIVGRVGNMLVFDLTPAIPYFRQAWSGKDFPTPREFGPPR